MAEPQKIRKAVALTPPVPPRQMIITFESSVLQLCGLVGREWRSAVIDSILGSC